MSRIQEGFAPLQLRANGMTAPHRESVAVLIEQLAVKSLEGIADADHEVERARELRSHDRRAAPGHDVEPQVRRQRGDLFHQPRKTRS
jgi:hypothetical protein